MESKPIIIAIDGPVASGKSTTAREAARRLGYLYIDSGAMYRVVALQALRAGASTSDPTTVGAIASEVRIGFSERNGETRVRLGDEDVTEAIRTPEVAEVASHVASLTEVREALIRIQREMGQSGGVVMDGRDIGTVVFPNADLKIYLKASPETRARRRHTELKARGVEITLQETKRQIRDRDARDWATQTRQSGGLWAPEAVVIDTTSLSIHEQVSTILSLALERGARLPGSGRT